MRIPGDRYDRVMSFHEQWDQVPPNESGGPSHDDLLILTILRNLF
jgi:hypothetical protein